MKKDFYHRTRLGFLESSYKTKFFFFSFGRRGFLRLEQKEKNLDNTKTIFFLCNIKASHKNPKRTYFSCFLISTIRRTKKRELKPFCFLLKHSKTFEKKEENQISRLVQIHTRWNTPLRRTSILCWHPASLCLISFLLLLFLLFIYFVYFNSF